MVRNKIISVDNMNLEQVFLCKLQTFVSMRLGNFGSKSTVMPNVMSRRPRTEYTYCCIGQMHSLSSSPVFFCSE